MVVVGGGQGGGGAGGVDVEGDNSGTHVRQVS